METLEDIRERAKKTQVLDREISCKEIMERLNRELTDELCITEAYIPKSDFSEIAYASYESEIFTAGASEKLAENIENILKDSGITIDRTQKLFKHQTEVHLFPNGFQVWGKGVSLL